MKFTPAAFKRIRPMESVYGVTNLDLNKFQVYDGKVILYPGYSDPSIVPTGLLAYYAKMVKQMGELDTTHKFSRLFIFSVYPTVAVAMG